MAENKNVKGRHLLTEKDFVDVVDADGKELPPVPKHWTEADLPAGAKVKSKSSKKSAGGSGGGSQRKQGEQPSGNGSRTDWAAYATEQGAPEEETAEDGGLSRDELRDKYGSSES